MTERESRPAGNEAANSSGNPRLPRDSVHDESGTHGGRPPRRASPALRTFRVVQQRMQREREAVRDRKQGS